jgi:hypothetical protein
LNNGIYFRCHDSDCPNLAEERLSLACEKAPTDDEARLMEGVSDCLMIVIWLVVTGTWLSDDFPYIGNNHHPI